jgi:CheY-like chemotaxis protein
MADDRAQCLGAGMNLYLAKPISLASLNAALLEAADSRTGASHAG